MRERPRQRRQSLSRPATTQFIPHVPQDSPRSDLRNVFYSPASSLQRRTRSGRCSCCAAPSHIHRLRLSLYSCVAVRLCATPAGSSCRFRSARFPVAPSARLHSPIRLRLRDITIRACHATSLPQHIASTIARTKKRRRSRNSSVPKLCVMPHVLPVGVPPQGYFHTGLTAGLRTNCSTTATDPCDPDGSRVHTTSP